MHENNATVNSYVCEKKRYKSDAEDRTQYGEMLGAKFNRTFYIDFETENINKHYSANTHHITHLLSPLRVCFPNSMFEIYSIWCATSTLSQCQCVRLYVCVYGYAYKPTLAHTHFPFGFSVYPHFFFFPVHLFQKYRVVGFFLLFTLTHHDRHRAISLYSICYLNFPLTTGMRVCEYTSSSFSCCCFCLYFLSLDRIYNINPFYSFFLSLSTLPLSFYLSSLSFD